ncbi:hypothetical protein BCEP4_220165 [Burkholderia cepacia]|nr:hypothetical protein BCEP4_220165 [Burkholderia cepacia]
MLWRPSRSGVAITCHKSRSDTRSVNCLLAYQAFASHEVARWPSAYMPRTHKNEPAPDAPQAAGPIYDSSPFSRFRSNECPTSPRIFASGITSRPLPRSGTSAVRLRASR